MEAWRIFTPLLDEIDASGVQPVVYPFGVRAPEGMDEFARRYGVEPGENCLEHLSLYADKMDKLKAPHLRRAEAIILARTCRNSTKLGPDSTNFGPNSSKFGPISTPELCHIRPNLAEVYQH